MHKRIPFWLRDGPLAEYHDYDSALHSLRVGKYPAQNDDEIGARRFNTARSRL